jgi:ATP-dependent DNA helicase RecQ
MSLASADSTTSPDYTAALQRYFGFSAFRHSQEDIVRRAVESRDTLALMPTGAGKSLCYQLAAMLRPTPTLVISPLIALMKDQVDHLPQSVAPYATLINSSLDYDEVARRQQGVVAGTFKLVYAAPERLRQRNFVAALRFAGFGLVVIDEVHCVSMWGHDFRPDYLFIRPALESLGNPTVLGLTATATRTTETDIAASLGRKMDVVRTSVVRPNLRYEVTHVENEDGRQKLMLTCARAFSGSGIVYARAREKCEVLAGILQQGGVKALHYHAGMDSDSRAKAQERFLRGDARVVVATTAFGMGIDKPDIRWILLYNFPDSLEDYVQRVGRAGRDGKQSTCILLAGDTDASSVRRFARQDLPSIGDLRGVYRCLRNQASEGWAEISPEELTSATGLGAEKDPRVLVGMLESAGLLRRDFDAGRAMRIELLPAPSDSSRRVERLLERYAAQALERANRMIAYGDAQSCRHQLVAAHFGENVRVPCGKCDSCAPRSADTAAAKVARPLPADIAGTLLETVRLLQWPLGVKGLAQTLHGSLEAPQSGQRSSAYGLFAAAGEHTIRRWIEELISHGTLEYFENERGYRLLRIGRAASAPVLQRFAPVPTNRETQESARQIKRDAATGPLDEVETELDGIEAVVFERLRVWRYNLAREHDHPAYTILPNSTLVSLARRRPKTLQGVSAIPGIGPRKLTQFGQSILEEIHKAERST